MVLGHSLRDCKRNKSFDPFTMPPKKRATQESAGAEPASKAPRHDNGEGPSTLSGPEHARESVSCDQSEGVRLHMPIQNLRAESISPSSMEPRIRFDTYASPDQHGIENTTRPRASQRASQRACNSMANLLLSTPDGNGS
jgi:hypothetical protein